MAGRRFARPSNNPTGKGGFVKGQVANPNGYNGNPVGVKEQDVRKLAQKWSRSAIATMAVIMMDRSNSAAVRLAAAEGLLNRGHGKPIQPHANPDLTPLNFDQMSLDQLLEAASRMRMALDLGVVPSQSLEETAH